VPINDYTPTAAQVAANIMSRTRNRYGALIGTFSANTTPTDTQIPTITDAVINEIADVIGDDIPQAFFDDAAKVVAKRVAMQIELDFYPEQVTSNRSTYKELKDQYEEALASLSRQITMAGEGETGATGSGEAKSPSYSFPPASDWLTRRM
jgi:U3 small nucleolar ribonucleoprotein component